MSQVIQELRALHAACKLWPPPACLAKALRQQARPGRAHGAEQRQMQGQGQDQVQGQGAYGPRRGFLDAQGGAEEEEDLLDLLAAGQPGKGGRLASQAGPSTSSSQHSQALYTYTGSEWSSGGPVQDAPALLGALHGAAAMAAVRAAALQVCAGAGVGGSAKPDSEAGAALQQEQGQFVQQGQGRNQQQQRTQQLVLPGQEMGQGPGKQAEPTPGTGDFTFRPASCSAPQALLPTSSSSPFPGSSPCFVTAAAVQSAGGHAPHAALMPHAQPPAAMRRSCEVLASPPMHGLHFSRGRNQGSRSQNSRSHGHMAHGLGHSHGHSHGHSGMWPGPMRNPSRLSRSSLDSCSPSVNGPSSGSSLGAALGDPYAGLTGIAAGSGAAGGAGGGGLTGLTGLVEGFYGGGTFPAAAGLGHGALGQAGSGAKGRPLREAAHVLRSRSLSSSRIHTFRVAGPGPAALQPQQQQLQRGCSLPPLFTPDLMLIDLEDEEQNVGPAPDPGLGRGWGKGWPPAATPGKGPVHGMSSTAQPNYGHQAQLFRWLEASSEPCFPILVPTSAGREGAHTGAAGPVVTGAGVGGLDPDWANCQLLPNTERRDFPSPFDLQRQFLLEQLEPGEVSFGFAAYAGESQGGAVTGHHQSEPSMARGGASLGVRHSNSKSRGSHSTVPWAALLHGREL